MTQKLGGCQDYLTDKIKEYIELQSSMLRLQESRLQICTQATYVGQRTNLCLQEYVTLRYVTPYITNSQEFSY